MYRDEMNRLQLIEIIPCRVTKAGGLLVIELGHPRDIFDGIYTSESDFVECWEVSESGNVQFAGKGDEKDEAEDIEDGSETADSSETADVTEDGVLVEYGREGDTFDIATQILDRTVGMSLIDGSGDIVSSRVHVISQRQYTLQEVELLARCSGWQVCKVLGDFSFDTQLDDEEAYRMIVILQKEK